MTRNQKIALGCGGAGCLGLIVVAIVAVLVYYFGYSQVYSSNRNVNVSINRNSNLNDNSDSNENKNSAGASASRSSASMSDDDKHRLYQAAAMTGDAQLLQRVSVKIGLMEDDYTPGDDYQQFLTDHVVWVMRNRDFIQSINTPAKARAYVDEHFPE